MTSCSIVSFYLKETTAGIFSLLMSVLIAIGFTIQKLSSYQDNQDSDKIRKQTQQEAILCNIIEKIKTAAIIVAAPIAIIVIVLIVVSLVSLVSLVSTRIITGTRIVSFSGVILITDIYHKCD